MEQYIYILLNVDKSHFVYNFPSNDPLILGDEPMIGLKSIFMWNTYANCSEKYDNNKVRVYYNNKWNDIEIPEGMYEVSALSETINRLVVHGTDVPNLNERAPPKILELGVDKSTFHCCVKLTPGVQIDFSQGKLHKLLGLEAKIYKNDEKGKKFINITRGVNDVMVRCNLVDRDFQYEYKDVLFDMLPSDPGRAVLREIQHPIEFYKCKNKHIRMLEIKITDQNNNLLHLNESAQIKIIFKYVQKN